MQYNTFYQPVSRDFVPQGSRCEWCNRPAVQRLTAIGGLHHNQCGCFCLLCGREFICIVSNNTASPATLVNKQPVIGAEKLVHA
jgi:hypothetical protein